MDFLLAYMHNRTNRIQPLNLPDSIARGSYRTSAITPRNGNKDSTIQPTGVTLLVGVSEG
jgi:hypothetical protein